ncbi:hypothetical protein BCR34DRAFT_604877 [Clohesyomyces aquaticus]|uniref:Uncharacterized protein n=1 Tax=Clohesyomyces aquaticus TaxID=1231657 RepID=A0A1Y1Z2N2_9PLEO|nr:hypothetical protein BCR34DRAFT_604877 [Clohesyomyces aquaticus]
MPSSSTTVSPLTTFLIVCFFTLAFFPSLFHTIIWSPYNLVFPPSEPRSITSGWCASPNSCVAPSSMSWTQKTLTLPSHSRGSYLITDHIVQSLPELKTYKIGLLHLFIQHTSCALSLNENWDSDVRADMSDALDRIVPEDKKGGLYRHDAEGSDDMPAHVKSALVGASVSIPIKDGKLATGTWQGIWYLEFRAARHSRKVVATMQGEKM